VELQVIFKNHNSSMESGIHGFYSCKMYFLWSRKNAITLRRIKPKLDLYVVVTGTFEDIV